MMERVAKHRRSMSGLPAEEQEKWGRGKAVDIVGGNIKYQFDAPPPPKDMESPQRLGDDANLRGPGWENDAQGWVRGCTSGKPQMKDETGEAMPHFDSRDPKTGLPKKW
jgi:hypothetical protein